MEKFFNLIWWPLTIMVLPLDGYLIMDYIAKNNFSFHFWFLTIAYILLCVVTGARLYLVATGRDN